MERRRSTQDSRSGSSSGRRCIASGAACEDAGVRRGDDALQAAPKSDGSIAMLSVSMASLRSDSYSCG